MTAVICTESTSILVREFERLGDKQVGAQPCLCGLLCLAYHVCYTGMMSYNGHACMHADDGSLAPGGAQSLQAGGS